MNLSANFALSRYAAIEYGVRGPASYVASTNDVLASGDAGIVFVQFYDEALGVVAASDLAVSFFFEPIAIFALEIEHRLEKLLTEIREIETDERKPFQLHTENRAETMHAHEPGEVRAEKRSEVIYEQRSQKISETRQTQAKASDRSTSIKSDNRNFKA